MKLGIRSRWRLISLYWCLTLFYWLLCEFRNQGRIQGWVLRSAHLPPSFRGPLNFILTGKISHACAGVCHVLVVNSYPSLSEILYPSLGAGHSGSSCGLDKTSRDRTDVQNRTESPDHDHDLPCQACHMTITSHHIFRHVWFRLRVKCECHCTISLCNEH